MSEAIKPVDSGDNNEEIMTLIKQRMDLGKQRYGHGVKVDDDTTQYGTEQDAWELMARFIAQSMAKVIGMNLTL